MKEGWEIGLHIINTKWSSKFYDSKGRVGSFFSHLEAQIYGVTPCGSTIGWKGEKTWNVMEYLNLQYLEGYGVPETELTTFVMPAHLSLDL